MTAEVAILNKQAVALAADSAVTTGGDERKIFNTVNKLFALSKSQPVGIMAYSSAEVMGVPVETVIKEFRRLRGSEKCFHLEEYAAAFEDYLRTNDLLFSEDTRKRCLSDLACGLVHELWTRTFEWTTTLGTPTIDWGHPTLREARTNLMQVLAYMEDRVRQSKPAQTAHSAKHKRLVADAIDPELSRAIVWLNSLVPGSARRNARIRKMVVEHFFRDLDFGGETGFVIAGFGTDDVFPRLRAFEFHYSACGLHKVRDGGQVDISVTMTAQIMPFAQWDVMATFVEGMYPKYKDMIRLFIGEYLENQKKMLMNENPPKVSEAAGVEALRANLVQQFPQVLNDLIAETSISPTMEVVSSMPKEELAVLAEALVNLTALKRKASRDAETVGGPTDVAVISKGDGFIWIQRKHYFDPKLNPAFGAGRLERGDA